MKISAATLYHPAPWGWLYSYQAILVVLRMGELAFMATRYLFFRGPLLMAWTRLPVLKNTNPPYKELAEVLAPPKTRASLSVGGGELGTSLAMIKSIPEASELLDAFLGQVEAPSRFWSIVGCYMRGFFTDMGPTMIKFGQIISMREEVPPTIRKELTMLQDKVPPMPFKKIKKILERELDRPVDEVFEWVDEKPIAAASLSQVHRAKLRKEQEEVALKVQRPHLEGITTLDTIIICDIFLGLVKRMLPLLNKSTDVDIFTSSFRGSLEKEIDFVLEARFQERFRIWIANHPIYKQTNYSARTYPDYCTGKLITMELIKNFYRLDRVMDELTPQQLLEFASVRIEGYPPDLPLQLVFAQMGVMAESMLRLGFAHGDFHLGNIYALAPQGENDNWKIFVCDFGMMIDLTEKERMLAMSSISGLAYYYDGGIMGDVFLNHCTLDKGKKMSLKQWRETREVFKDVATKYVVGWDEEAEKVWHFRLQRGTSDNLVSGILYGAATKGLRVDPFSWLFLKNFCYAANIGLTFSTSASATQVMQPHLAKWVKDSVVENMRIRDIDDLRDSLPEVLSVLRAYDYKQVMRGLLNGGDVKPKSGGWFAAKTDTRFGETPKQIESMDTRSGGLGTHSGKMEMMLDDRRETV